MLTGTIVYYRFGEGKDNYQKVPNAGDATSLGLFVAHRSLPTCLTDVSPHHHGGVLAAATAWSRRKPLLFCCSVVMLNLPGVYHACSTLDGPQRGKNAERLQLVLVCFAHEIENA